MVEPGRAGEPPLAAIDDYESLEILPVYPVVFLLLIFIAADFRGSLIFGDLRGSLIAGK